MRKSVFCIIFSLSSVLVFAQENEEASRQRILNNVNLSILGDFSLLSLNYERLFFSRESFFVTGKVGAGYTKEFRISLWGRFSTPPEHFLVVPHHLTANFGKGIYFFEVGVGGAAVTGSETRNYSLYPIAGFRMQPLQPKNVNFRVYVTYPYIGRVTTPVIYFPVGTSVGYCF